MQWLRDLMCRVGLHRWASVSSVAAGDYVPCCKHCRMYEDGSYRW